MSDHKRIVQYVNRLRAKVGADPIERLPPGYCNSPKDCPIARSVPGDVLVTGTCTYIEQEEGELDLEVVNPKYIKEWITRFDAGKYPELVA